MHDYCAKTPFRCKQEKTTGDFLWLCSVWDKVNLKVTLGISTDQTDVVPTLDKSDLRSSIKDKCLKCMIDGKDHSSPEIFRPFLEPMTRFFFCVFVVVFSLPLSLP